MQDLDKFKNEMNLSGKNVYVGHRYVPKMMGDWDNTKIYEPLSVVTYQGASYTSRQYVPTGIEITNEDFWVLSGNYNAQVEHYRQEVINVTNEVKTGLKNVNDEVVNARGNESTLNARLERDNQEVNTKLTQTEERMKLSSYKKYGEIQLPSDFNHDIDFRIWRDYDGKIKHNFNIDNYITGYTNFYISENGDNTNDGKSEQTPFLSLSHAIDTIEADPSVSSAKINIMNSLSRNRTLTTRTITKNYYLCAENETYIGGIEGGLVWSKQSNGLYRAAENIPVAVYDSKFKVEFGLPYKYEKVNNVSQCLVKKGSWYTDGTYTYINRLDGSQPNNDIYVALAIATFDITFGADCMLAMKNVTIINGNIGRANYFHSDTTTQGKMILDNVKAIKNGGDGEGNGLFYNNVKSIWQFNCGVTDTSSDGFNYHSSIDGKTFVLEYNCFSQNNGLENSTGNQNATTAHDGIHILRIGSVGTLSKGPVLADVNGCYSIIIDTTMQQSTREPYITKASYFFDDSPSPHDTNPNGKVLLINSSGGSAETYGINCGESFKENKITIDNFNGLNIPNDINFNIL